MKQLRLIWFIALKDLRLFITDRMALFFFVAFPFLFIVMFNFLLADVGGEDNLLTFNLVTRETSGGLSHQIINAIETKDDSQLEPGQVRIVRLEDYDEAYRMVENKELGGFLAFPADFTEGIMTSSGAELEVVTDAEDINTRAALYGLADAIASQIGTQQIVSNTTVGLLIEQGLISGEMPDIGQVLFQPFSGETGTTGVSLIDFKTEKLGEVKAEKPTDYIIPGYLVMFVFFAAALSAEAIVRERQNHTLERLLSSSVRKEPILGGIFTGTAAKGLIQIIIFWTVGLLVFKVDLGLSPVAVIVLSVLMVIMSAAFGLMLATLVRTERSAGSIAVLASLLMAPLGGCWWPLFMYPKWMQTIARVTPHAWAVGGFNKLMLFGAEFTDVIPEMIALVGFAILFGLIAIWRFGTSASQT